MNTMGGKESQLLKLLEPTVDMLGYKLWGLELLSPNRRPTLRVYIDKALGVTVDDCASVSRHLAGVLDVEDPFVGEYTLEVSSPGIDRLLFKREQFMDYEAQPVEVKLRFPFEGRRKFRGWFLGFDGDDIVVRVDKHESLLPLNSIDRARVQPTAEWIERARPAAVTELNESVKEGDAVLDNQSET
ncbi:MAG: ribosome maturation factor RimP [Cellvibrionales bacterium TMED79]|nr:ribosome maturation factor RimP [Halieaceae bacterium]OUU99273.1 MAG: ribosome maturation factor RimP [Cellvibrionales bacterium TMED79]